MVSSTIFGVFGMTRSGIEPRSPGRLANTLPTRQMFANGLGDLGSIPGRVIPKTQKWYFIPLYLTLSDIRYVSRVKWSNPGKGVAPSPTPQYSSYWKGRLLVALDYGRQIYFYLYYFNSCWIKKITFLRIKVFYLFIFFHFFPNLILKVICP